MSLGKKIWMYPAVAVVLAVIVIGAAGLYMQAQPKSPSSSYSVLAIRLTDPPRVPDGTQWLNLTYSQISLLVGEPTGSGNEMNTQTVTVTPQGGSATVDLMALQNYAETVGVASLPQGSVLYAVTFQVSAIKIDINGSQYGVTLAQGNSLQAVIANPKSLSGNNDALIELNPVVVSTPTGYQLIPSTVAVVSPSQGEHDHEGSISALSEQDRQDLEQAQGSLTVAVQSLKVVGDTTTFIVEVNNTGNIPVQIVAIGLHGSFNVTGSACKAGEQGGQSQDNGSPNQPNTSDHGENGAGSGAPPAAADGHECEHPDEVVFLPVNQSSSVSSSSTSSTSSSSTTSSSTTVTSSSKCSTFNLSLASGEGNDNAQSNEDQQSAGIMIQPGQCFKLEYNATITFGSSGLTLVPSLTTGSTYIVHFIASNGAQERLSCSVPVSPASCAAVTPEDDQSS